MVNIKKDPKEHDAKSGVNESSYNDSNDIYSSSDAPYSSDHDKQENTWDGSCGNSRHVFLSRRLREKISDLKN